MIINVVIRRRAEEAVEVWWSNQGAARIISGMRSFFKYCIVENIVTKDPTILLEAPKLQRKLPDVLSFEEIESIISQIDMSKAEGGRNKAILETLYSCGLRVSELINLRLSCLYLDVDRCRSGVRVKTEKLNIMFLLAEESKIG